MKRQHEPLRIPGNWKEQERSFLLQMERILDDIYALISKAEERLKALEESEEETAAEEEEETT